jgi:hypothetical protein
MAKEKVSLMSRIIIEKYNENMELEDIHESKVPSYAEGNGVKEIKVGQETEKK